MALVPLHAWRSHLRCVLGDWQKRIRHFPAVALRALMAFLSLPQPMSQEPQFGPAWGCSPCSRAVAERPGSSLALCGCLGPMLSAEQTSCPRYLITSHPHPPQQPGFRESGCSTGEQHSVKILLYNSLAASGKPKVQQNSSHSYLFSILFHSGSWIQTKYLPKFFRPLIGFQTWNYSTRLLNEMG